MATPSPILKNSSRAENIFKMFIFNNNPPPKRLYGSPISPLKNLLVESVSVPCSVSSMKYDRIPVDIYGYTRDLS